MNERKRLPTEMLCRFGSARPFVSQQRPQTKHVDENLLAGTIKGVTK
jgi:hypothetical protein